MGQGGFEIYLNVAQNISLVMLLPLVLALAARRFYPRAIAWPRKLKDVTFGIWVVILVLIAANASYDISSRDGISERVLEQIGAVSLLVCGINFGLGHLLGGRTRAAECSQALGQKNTKRQEKAFPGRSRGLAGKRLSSAGLFAFRCSGDFLPMQKA